MENAKSYSGLFIISPELLETMGDVQTRIKAIISENAGEVVSENVMGKKALAYPINKKSEGIYYEIVFNAPPASVDKITKQCRISNDIMRTVIDKRPK